MLCHFCGNRIGDADECPTCGARNVGGTWSAPPPVPDLGGVAEAETWLDPLPPRTADGGPTSTVEPNSTRVPLPVVVVVVGSFAVLAVIVAVLLSGGGDSAVTTPQATTVTSAVAAMDPAAKSTLDSIEAADKAVLNAPSTTRPMVTLSLIGTGSASVTYHSGGNGMAHEYVMLPWFVEDPIGDFHYVSGRLDGTGSITCKISGPGGDVLTTVTSSGRYVIATCSA